MPRPPLYLAPCFFLLLPGLWADTEAGQAAYLKQDWPTALREFQAGVKSGEVEALFWIGVFYSTDHPSYPRDPYRAFAYTLQAAERGHPIAECWWPMPMSEVMGLSRTTPSPFVGCNWPSRTASRRIPRRRAFCYWPGNQMTPGPSIAPILSEPPKLAMRWRAVTLMRLSPSSQGWLGAA